MKDRFRIGRLLEFIFNPSKSNAEIFDNIYSKNLWGAGDNSDDGIFSGAGSLPENAGPYEDFVVTYAQREQIDRIVDIGCGDFQVGRRIMERLPKVVSYLGLDVSRRVIERNRARWIDPRVRFEVLDVATTDPPAAPLGLCREVLQHLSNAQVREALARMTRGFDRLLVTNVQHHEPAAINADITPGRSRAPCKSGLWLDRPPFDLRCREVLRVPHSRDPKDIVTIEWQRGRE